MSICIQTYSAYGHGYIHIHIHTHISTHRVPHLSIGGALVDVGPRRRKVAHELACITGRHNRQWWKAGSPARHTPSKVAHELACIKGSTTGNGGKQVHQQGTHQGKGKHQARQCTSLPASRRAPRATRWKAAVIEGQTQGKVMDTSLPAGKPACMQACVHHDERHRQGNGHRQGKVMDTSLPAGKPACLQACVHHDERHRLWRRATSPLG
eukprot:1161625-Pelagomonas_calceolata.AAC.28